MSLLDAPGYDEKKAQRQRNLLIGLAALVVLTGLLTLGGYVAGHGWLFTNLPAEHRVDTFLTALEAKDYGRAYGIYLNDPEWAQHPAKTRDYPLDRFTEDWTAESPAGAPISSHKIDISRTDGTGTFGTGIIVAAEVNGGKRLFLWYQRSDGTLTYPAPHEIRY